MYFFIFSEITGTATSGQKNIILPLFLEIFQRCTTLFLSARVSLGYLAQYVLFYEVYTLCRWVVQYISTTSQHCLCSCTGQEPYYPLDCVRKHEFLHQRVPNTSSAHQLSVPAALQLTEALQASKNSNKWLYLHVCVRSGTLCMWQLHLHLA